MIPCVRCKPGVEFAVISPGGMRILAALEFAADKISHDLTITSGTDGVHSGPEDPHKSGSAYDIRTKDLPDALLALNAIKDFLAIPEDQQEGSRFFAWIEQAGTDNEHIHVQVRKGTVYPPAPLSNNAEAVSDALEGS